MTPPGQRCRGGAAASAATVTALVDGRFDDGLTDADGALRHARRTGHDAHGRTAAPGDDPRRPGAAGLGGGARGRRDSGAPRHRRPGDRAFGREQPHHGRRDARPARGRPGAAISSSGGRRTRPRGLGAQLGALLANVDLHAGKLRAALARLKDLVELPLDTLAA